jgi:sugar phosphate isomerase/epimerase
MFYSGISDEAGKPIDVQIKAHRELGWKHIELRNVLTQAFTDVSDAEFDAISGKLADAGLQVSCFASPIANWACKITDDFQRDVDILKRSIPRMKKLNTPFIRIMSYENNGLTEDDWRKEAVRRVKELSKMAEDGGVTLVLENCGGWASAKAENFSRFYELVNSPALKAVYDTGNPASHGHTNTWDWYLAAKPHIAYVHIKCHTGPRSAEDKGEHVWPEEGASLIAKTMKDLIASGYDGGFSIEPHLKVVYHEANQISDEDAAYRTYVEYGRRMVKMVEATL